MADIPEAKARKTTERQVTITHYAWECPLCGEECIDESYSGLNYYMYCPECDAHFYVSSD